MWVRKREHDFVLSMLDKLDKLKETPAGNSLPPSLPPSLV